VTDDNYNGGDSVLFDTLTFILEVKEPTCFAASYEDLVISVGEQATLAISADFNEGVCTPASFDFEKQDGSALPAFVFASGSSVDVEPSSNSQAGVYEIVPILTYGGTT